MPRTRITQLRRFKPWSGTPCTRGKSCQHGQRGGNEGLSLRLLLLLLLHLLLLLLMLLLLLVG